MDTRIKIAAIDDDETFLNEEVSKISLILEVNKIDNYILDYYNSGIELLRSKLEYHILILDIEMADINGLELAAEVRRWDRNPVIIFLTGHDRFMEKGFHVRAFRFLIKPFSNEKLIEAILSAVRQVLEMESIIIKNNGKQYVVDVSEIKYIEALGEGCCLYIGKYKVFNSEPLKRWIKSLPEEVLIQTHRSYIVNLRYVKEITSDYVILKSGEKIPLATRRKKNVNTKLHDYVRKKRGIISC